MSDERMRETPADIETAVARYGRAGRHAEGVAVDAMTSSEVMIGEDLAAARLKICRQYGSQFDPPSHGLKVGVARNVRSGLLPINGLRHTPAAGTTGWYIWAGDTLSDAPDFFEPLHVEHIETWCPRVLPYLALEPGWRFLVADGYEDVWRDDTLLRVNG